MLVHSPVVGPTTWRWVGEKLAVLGHRADVPDLREASLSGDPQAFIDAARAHLSSDTDVIVGHSGAGFFLPVIALPPASALRMVFVDAGVPPCEGEGTAGGSFVERLRELASNGVLPPWSRWWGEGAMEMLVSDPDRRRSIEGELPEVPIRFFESPVALPDGWCGWPAAFVLLSESYRSDAATAAALGWPVVEHLGTHLDVVNQPTVIAESLVALAA
jgi:hypothetical protein